MKKIVFITLCFAFLGLISCGTKNKFKVDVSKVEVNVSVQRLDEDLFKLNPDEVEQKIPELIKKYGNFFDLFSQEIIKIGNPSDREFADNLRQFITDFTMRETYEAIKKEYSNIQVLENELKEAFKYYKYYFPNKNIPKIYTMLSGFNQAVVTDNEIVAIGLDLYLRQGKDYYDRLQIPKYLQYKMRADRILPDCMYAIAQMEFPYNDSVDNVLTNMVYQGKLAYFQHAMLPNTKDSVIFGYTANQLTHSTKFEQRIWKYIVEKKMLFSSDKLTINKLISDSPFTSFFGNNSAPRAGHFIGYKIVSAYMKNNPKITLKELMSEKNYETILQMSGYNPEE